MRLFPSDLLVDLHEIPAAAAKDLHRALPCRWTSNT